MAPARAGDRAPTRPAGTTSRPATAKARPRKPTQAERFAAQRRARHRRALRNRIIVWGVVVFAAGGLVFNWVNDRRQSQRLISSLEAGSCDFDRDTDSGRDHVPAPSYQVDPPSGGDHLAAPAPAGTYSADNVPADGNLVHALEHGFVILWQGPELTDVELDAMDDVASQHQRDVLVVPRPSLPTPVAATAWHKRLLCSTVEPDALRSFVDEFRNDGPEDVPH
ncbi:MAG: DUF3105 domain-containing protein [Acidimicrobiales bacterium]